MENMAGGTTKVTHRGEEWQTEVEPVWVQCTCMHVPTWNGSSTSRLLPVTYTDLW